MFKAKGEPTDYEVAKSILSKEIKGVHFKGSSQQEMRIAAVLVEAKLLYGEVEKMEDGSKRVSHTFISEAGVNWYLNRNWLHRHLTKIAIAISILSFILSLAMALKPLPW